MKNLVQRFQRKLQAARNRFMPVDRHRIAQFMEMAEHAPRSRPEIADWSASMQHLIQQLVLKRISDDDLALILAGLISHRQTGITPENTQQALVRAYENTSGLFQEMLHKALFARSDDSKISIESGLFGDVDGNYAGSVVDEIRTNGYVVLRTKISLDLIDRISSESKGYAYQLKGGKAAGQRISGIDPDAPPPCVSAYAASPDPHRSELLRQLSNDPLLIYIASAHLGCESKPIDSTFWYTFADPTPCSETAQLFHYDLDTIRWVKVFVYLTDVGPDNGPHEYVEGSHRPENKAPEILMRHYSRIDDAEIDASYPGKRRQVTGDAGTVIIGDTRCFHKGNAVSSGYRLIYSPIYAPSTIGYFHG